MSVRFCQSKVFLRTGHFATCGWYSANLLLSLCTRSMAILGVPPIFGKSAIYGAWLRLLLLVLPYQLTRPTTSSLTEVVLCT
jgi:hypothetical protein